MREKCPHTDLFLVHTFPHLDWIRRDTTYISVFSSNGGKSGPEKTPCLDTFHEVHCQMMQLHVKTRSSHSQMFFKLGVLKHFTNFTGKHLFWTLFLIRLQAFYLLKVNNRNSRTRCGICSKITIKTPECRQWRRSGVFNVNFEHISHLFLMFLMLTFNKYLPAELLR